MADGGTNDGGTNDTGTNNAGTNNAGTNDDEHVAWSVPPEEANTSPTRPKVIAMEFVVHVCVKFDDSAEGYSGGKVGYMTFLEPEGVDWFLMLENLAFHGYKGNSSLYYLKPGYKPPQGLVLMEGAEHLQQLMRDHEGLKICKLFIVKPPRTSKSSAETNMNEDGYDDWISDGSDNSISDEEYAWEGEEGDEDLYVSKSSNGSKQNPKQPAKRLLISEIDNPRVYLPEEPIEEVHSPINSDDDGIYVHRSLGVDYVRFDESTMRHPIMNVGTVFTDIKQFRKALKNLIIDEGRAVYKPKNDSAQVSAKCKSEDCPWYIYASRLPDGRSFKIKKFTKDHSCGKSHTIKQMDAKWIGTEYEDFFRSEKDWRVRSLRDTVLRDTQVGISLTKAYRAKRYAVQKIDGDYVEQYRKLQDYAHTVLYVNPGSSIVIKCFVDPTRAINPRFERMYVSFDAQIKGFLAGCRPFIGFDGTHVKLPNGGQILTAQGRDANNNLFPIAFALVESENGNSWTWFLELLVNSIGQGEHCGGWTIMSDRQKGLKDAVKTIFPHADHRYCLRHLYANFSKAGFKSPRLKELMDRAAYAYKEFDFNQAMNEIKKENTRAWKWLSDIDSKHWSRHRFSPHAKTDLVVNNISESYNAWILEAREQPVCTMMEHIRTKLMESLSIKRDGAEKDTWFIAPNYQKRLEFEKKNASNCRAVCAGRGIWQVTSGDSQYVVDLNNHKCGCYKWDVTGVPCLHAVAAIHEFKHKPENYMSLFFTRDKYVATYEGMIMPVPDKTQWLRTDLPDVDPPLYHAHPGRPKKKRVRAQGEPRVEARASKKAAVKCSNCHSYGHNVKGCGLPLRPDWVPRKGAKYTRESIGVPPACQSSQPTCEGASQPNQPTCEGSMPETWQYNLVPFEGPIFMNNDQGIGVYHDIEGGPRIRPRKMFPLRRS